MRYIMGSRQHSISVNFTPPFPEITALQDETALEGQFIIKANEESAGIIRGTYHLSRKDDEIQIRMYPCGGWVPKSDTFILLYPI